MRFWLYDLAIHVFTFAIRQAALFNPKAHLWVMGRKEWRERLAQEPIIVHRSSFKILWIHAASLGEFEQGRPIIEVFRERFPHWKIVLTFFSPSGYEIRKDYPHADLVCYLPADTRQNARDFLNLIQPDLAIFIKYEFWANYLFELKKRDVPTLLVSALFRPSQPFFKWYGGFWREMLGCFTHIFVQNELSGQLLQNIGIQNLTVAGDTRVDRVLKIAENAPLNEIVQDFVGAGSDQVLVVGSSWEADESVILDSIRTDTKHLKLIIAPHEPSESNVMRIVKKVENAVRYSRWFEVTSPRHEEVSSQTSSRMPSGEMSPPLTSEVSSQTSSRMPSGEMSPLTSEVSSQTSSGMPFGEMSPPRTSEMTPPQKSYLIIDNIGLLNTLYRYGTVAYIGGGFGKGIHNTLEPAAFGLPIIFGPKYEKFEEARQFVSRGGAFSIRNSEELATILFKLQDPGFYKNASDAVLAYLEENRGATGKVMAFIEEIFGGH